MGFQGVVYLPPLASFFLNVLADVKATVQKHWLGVSNGVLPVETLAPKNPHCCVNQILRS